MDDNSTVMGEVKKFNRGSLKKTDTTVKDILPSKTDIEQEKKEGKEEKK